MSYITKPATLPTNFLLKLQDGMTLSAKPASLPTNFQHMHFKSQDGMTLAIGNR